MSAWQKLTLSSWQTAYANGARFAYIKATEGTDYVSSQFGEQYNDSLAAGLMHGAYHFATPDTSSGATQANYFVMNGGSWTRDGMTLPPLLDIEYNPYGDTCYGLSQSAMVNWISDFSNTVYSRTGRLPAIYSTTDWWTRCTGNSAAFARNPLFIARYPSSISSGAGTLPSGWTSYTFWQYADSGIYPGDQDVFNGNMAQLTSLAVTGSAPHAPPIFGVGDVNGDGNPDVEARKPDGTLWLYPGRGNGTLGPGVQINAGWQIYDDVIPVGDVNGDGIPDLLARRPDGSLWFYAGTGTSGITSDGGLKPGVKIDNGWNIYQTIVAPGDLNGDGHPDLLGIRLDGSLWFYAGTGNTGAGSSGFKPGVMIDSGWSQFDTVIGTGDLNGDRKNDLLARKPDGTLWYYAGTGNTSPQSSGFQSGVQVDGGWNIFDVVSNAGDLNKDGLADVLARKPDGSLWLYSGNTKFGKTSTGLSPSIQVNAGWSVFDTLIAGDFNGDRRTDLLARKPDGTLWYYAGTGTTGSTSDGGFKPGVQVDGGWNIYDSVVAGDFNHDGKTDLLARKPDGTLWYYAGTGTTGTPGASPSGMQAGIQINSGWNIYDTLIAGDFNGDGKTDLLARKPDGTLWYYAGTGTVQLLGTVPPFTATSLGGGWNMFA